MIARIADAVQDVMFRRLRHSYPVPHTAIRSYGQTVILIVSRSLGVAGWLDNAWLLLRQTEISILSCANLQYGAPVDFSGSFFDLRSNKSARLEKVIQGGLFIGFTDLHPLLHRPIRSWRAWSATTLFDQLDNAVLG